MAQFVMLTRISPDALRDPTTFAQLGHQVTQKIHQECPQVRWLTSYAILGPYDYLDMFEAPDDATAAKVAVIVRSFGHATTEIWGAVPYDRFLQLAQEAA
ncbi:MAG: GYD domain-containing protein [Chloroflexi bacterium]|nr:GYD domain-containing protein [Chloroflexota bacterium]